MKNNHKLVNCDTDSITICKPNCEPFSEEELQHILKEINNLYPEGLLWEDDGYYETFIVLKAKNYIMHDGKKLSVKGSGLKSSKNEPAIKEFHMEIVNAMIKGETNYTEIYNKYVKEIRNLKDIKRWCSKKTLTQKVFESPRPNEAKIRDAIVNSEYVEGDKIYVFFKQDESLCLAENFDGDYNEDRLFNRLYSASKLFSKVITIEDYFVNYKLKKNKTKLLEIPLDI